MNLADLAGRRVAVWGLGQEGRALVALLAGRGEPPLTVEDATGPVEGHPAGVAPPVTPDRVDWSALDVVVRSPGVSRYRPELEAAARAGVVVTTAMALWLDGVAGRRVLAVTGTKGKSTTATLAAALLEATGLRTLLLGNIGVPVAEAVDAPAPEAYVVEVSSFQAAEVVAAPPVVVLTSLAPDHLDWHGDEERYYRDKLRLVTAGPPGALAVNAGSPTALDRTVGHPDRHLYGPEGEVAYVAGAGVVADGSVLIPDGTLAVPGRHQWWNLCGAVAGVALLTGRPVGAGPAERVAREFRGLPSRCQTIGVRAGVTYVDDALASNPFATEASLAAFAGAELTVILGGADRGVDAGDLLAALGARRPHPHVVVLDPDPFDIAENGLRSTAPLHRASSIVEAVDIAAEVTPPGGVVLFSPAAPTPPGEGGYRARSRRFATAAGLDR